MFGLRASAIRVDPGAIHALSTSQIDGEKLVLVLVLVLGRSSVVCSPGISVARRRPQLWQEREPWSRHRLFQLDSLLSVAQPAGVRPLLLTTNVVRSLWLG